MLTDALSLHTKVRNLYFRPFLCILRFMLVSRRVDELFLATCCALMKKVGVSVVSIPTKLHVAVEAACRD